MYRSNLHGWHPRFPDNGRLRLSTQLQALLPAGATGSATCCCLQLSYVPATTVGPTNSSPGRGYALCHQPQPGLHCWLPPTLAEDALPSPDEDCTFCPPPCQPQLEQHYRLLTLLPPASGQGCAPHCASPTGDALPTAIPSWDVLLNLACQTIDATRLECPRF